MNDNERIKLISGCKAEVTVMDSKVVVVDLMKISTKEFREMTDPKMGTDGEEKLIARITGIPLNEIQLMVRPDYILVASAVLMTAFRPPKDETRIEIVEGFKSKVTTYSGDVITIDLMKFTQAEWSKAYSAGGDEAVVLSKATGISVEDFMKMPLGDYKIIAHGLREAGNKPLGNPF
jgi:hypothetical protein